MLFFPQVGQGTDEDQVAAVEDIQPTLKAIGCYERYDRAIRSVVPEFGEGWKSKIVLPGDLLDSDRINVYRVVAEDPGGRRQTCNPIAAAGNQPAG